MKASSILGLNSRQKQYKALNSLDARRAANSKLRSKRLLKEAGVSVPELYKVFRDMNQVKQFDFFNIQTSFVVKPSAGSGGKGILIIRKRADNGKGFVDIDGDFLYESDIKLHINDILEGQYSTFGANHRAFVEERVPRHPKFKKYVFRGTPDIRVLVYNRVPVMAMLRLPTKESEGRANLHQGAIGVGIDLATGITLKGVYHGKAVNYVPGSKRKLNGLRIPSWTATLRSAVAAAEAIGLAYGGIDLLLHPEKGPMVVEVNASPGLAIQLANKAGLKWRLERVEGLTIRDADHGVRVGKSLFAEYFADKVKAQEGLVIIDAVEKVKVVDSNKKSHELEALVDTATYRTALDEALAKSFGLLKEENLLWDDTKTQGKSGKVVECGLWVKGRKITTAVTITKRSKQKYKLVIGRKDLQGFLVNPQLNS